MKIKKLRTKMDRQNVITEITDNYIDTVVNDIRSSNDLSFLDSIIRGEGFIQVNNMSDEQLENEYAELFKVNIKIVDDID